MARAHAEARYMKYSVAMKHAKEAPTQQHIRGWGTDGLELHQGFRHSEAQGILGMRANQGLRHTEAHLKQALGTRLSTLSKLGFTSRP